MLRTIRRLHRVLVDRLAETKWLRDRAGAHASWHHYEHHARAWSRAAKRHAAARARAKGMPDRLHGRSAASSRQRHSSDVSKG
jgi:hypothetical protein